MVGFLNDRQKERQFCIPNDEKERGAKVLRLGIERVIEELLISVTSPGKFDAIKKVGYGERIFPSGAGEAREHLVPGSEVVEGYCMYIVIAVGKKCFNDPITMRRCVPGTRGVSLL